MSLQQLRHSPKFTVGDIILSRGIFINKIIKITDVYTISWLGNLVNKHIELREEYIFSEEFESSEERSRVLTNIEKAQLL